MTGAESTEQSAEACPVCGKHRVTMLGFPEIHTVGYQQYLDLVGMGEAGADTPPSIACLECGTEWPDLATFRRAQRVTRGREPGAS